MSQTHDLDSNGNKKVMTSRRAGGGAGSKRDKQLSSDNTIGTPAGQGKLGHKNDPFYVAKRGIFRKAESFNKKFNSDVFIVIH